MKLVNVYLLKMVQQYKVPEIDLLTEYLHRESDKTFNAIMNLINFSRIPIYYYPQLKSYINILSNQYFIIYPNYSLVERKYMIFRAIMNIYHSDQQDIKLFIADYEKLPKDPSNEIYKQITYNMPAYYEAANKDTLPILNEINNLINQ